MEHSKTRRELLAQAAAGVAATSSLFSKSSIAQPRSGVVKMVTSSGPGGFDVFARLIAPHFSKSFGGTLIVDNKPGANGNVAMAEVARATPDGSTLCLAATGTLCINQFIYPKMPVNPDTAFAPVALLGSVPMVWLTNGKSDLRSMSDVVARSRARNGVLNFALVANGSINHLILESLHLNQKIKTTVIPYKSTPFAEQALMAGEVDVMVSSLGTSIGHIRSERLRALAVTTERRSSILPDVPTMQELQLERQEFVGWYGVAAPAATPKLTLDALNDAILQATARDDVIASFANLGAIPGRMSNAEFGKFLQGERSKWGAIAKAANIRLE